MKPLAILVLSVIMSSASGMVIIRSAETIQVGVWPIKSEIVSWDGYFLGLLINRAIRFVTVCSPFEDSCGVCLNFCCICFK